MKNKVTLMIIAGIMCTGLQAASNNPFSRVLSDQTKNAQEKITAIRALISQGHNVATYGYDVNSVDMDGETIATRAARANNLNDLLIAMAAAAHLLDRANRYGEDPYTLLRKSGAPVFENDVTGQVIEKAMVFSQDPDQDQWPTQFKVTRCVKADKLCFGPGQCLYYCSQSSAEIVNH